MRVLYHHRTLGDGAEGVHVREMVRALRALGHEVHVSALVGEPASHDTRERRRWLSLSRNIPEAAYEVAELAYNFVGRRRVARDIADFRPHFVYDRYNSYSTAAVAAARRAGLPLILEVNAPVVYERTAYEHLQLRWPRLALRYERRILNAATHIVAVSTPLKDYLVATHGVPPAKVTVMPNGADPHNFHPGISRTPVRAALGLGEDDVLVGFSGNARPWHGLTLALEALVQLLPTQPRLQLMILGGGPSEPLLRQLASAQGAAGHVHFVERVDHADVPSYLAAMDIALSPRATFYASPLKIVESMAMGTAIVAPGTPNIEDLLTHEQSALLFEPESVHALRSAIARLVADRPLRGRLGAEARRLVEERFNWRAIADRTVALAAQQSLPHSPAGA